MELRLSKTPVATAGMLISKPTDDDYLAFVDPDVTTKSWFTGSSGKLEVGKRLLWKWEMYHTGTALKVKKLEPGKNILLVWGLDDQPNMVEWDFTPRGKEATYVEITNYGFGGDGGAVVAKRWTQPRDLSWCWPDSRLT